MVSGVGWGVNPDWFPPLIVNSYAQNPGSRLPIDSLYVAIDAISRAPGAGGLTLGALYSGF